jgi:hypothetical protein
LTSKIDDHLNATSEAVLGFALLSVKFGAPRNKCREEAETRRNSQLTLIAYG